MLLAAAALIVPAAAGAHATRAHAAQSHAMWAGKGPQLTVTVDPASEVESDNSSIAAVIEVEANPVFAEDTVTLESSQLFNHCAHLLTWNTDNNVAWNSSISVSDSTTVTLDDDGTALATVEGGPSCAAGKALVVADLNAAPYYTAKTRFTIKPPQDTPVGITAMPSSLVEDDASDVATVVQVEFPSVYAESWVDITSSQLYNHCDHLLTWEPVGNNGTVTTGDSTTVQLDDNGNALAIVYGGPSCAAGKSLIVADLENAPYRTLTTKFTILSPRCTAACGGPAESRRS